MGTRPCVCTHSHKMRYISHVCCQGLVHADHNYIIYLFMVHTMYTLIQVFVSAVKHGDKKEVESLLHNTEIDIDVDLPDVCFMFVVCYCLLHTH